MKKGDIEGVIEDFLKPHMRLNKSPYVYHASEAWKCPKQLVLKRLLPKEPGREKWGFFKIGTMFHRAIEDYLEWRDDHDVEVEKRWVDERDGIEVRCHPDIVHLDSNGDPDSISEVKTTKYLSYVEDGPRDHHVKQLQMYLNAAPADQGFLVYIQKEDFSYEVHRVERDRQVYENIISKFLRVRDCLEDGVIPDEPKYDPESWKCDFCPYSEMCRMGSDVIKKMIEKKEVL